MLTLLSIAVCINWQNLANRLHFRAFPRELPDSRAVAAATRLEDIGVELLLLNMNFGNMTHAEAMLSLRLFGTEVLLAFRWIAGVRRRPGQPHGATAAGTRSF